MKKNPTQKPARTPAKARRKSETLILNPAAALAFKQAVSRYYSEERALHNGKETRDAYARAYLKRVLGNRLLALACEAVLEKPGPITEGSAWWKLVLAQMSAEEIAADMAMMDAQFSTRGGSLEPIDDAREAAAIQQLEARKAPAADNQVAPNNCADPAPLNKPDHPRLPIERKIGCIERGGTDEPLFGFEMTPHGWQRIQQMLATKEEVQIVFRIERGEVHAFTGWRFMAPDADDAD